MARIFHQGNILLVFDLDGMFHEILSSLLFKRKLYSRQILHVKKVCVEILSAFLEVEEIL